MSFQFISEQNQEQNKQFQEFFESSIAENYEVPTEEAINKIFTDIVRIYLFFLIILVYRNNIY